MENLRASLSQPFDNGLADDERTTPHIGLGDTNDYFKRGTGTIKCTFPLSPSIGTGSGATHHAWSLYRTLPPARVIKRWDVFWKALYKEEWLKRNDFTALHLFNFGSCAPVHDDKNHSEPMSCRLCCESTRSDQIQKHLYTSCESSKYWWRKLESPRPMNLKEMLSLADTSFHNLRRLNRFVKVVKATYHSRYKDTRSEHLPLEPLLTRELDHALGRTTPMGR